MDNKLPLLLVIILICIIYYPILNNDILYDWDDQWMVANHLTMSGLTFENILRIFTKTHHNQYSPLTELNYLLIYTFFKYNATAYHTVSLIWHIGCVYLIYRFILKLLIIENKTETKNSMKIAILTSLLFGIHPMNVESVAWISAVKVLIYSFFYLCALLSYLKYISTNKLKYYLITIGLFICACCGKEQAVSFPLYVIILDWFTGRNMRSKLLWIEKITFLSISILFGVITIESQGSINSQVYPLTQRLILSSYALFEYISKGLIPLNLNYLYPFPMNYGDTLPNRFYIYPFLTIGLLVYVYTIKKNKLFILLIGSFIINLALSLNIIHMQRAAIIADRYYYLSGFSISFLASYSYFHLSEKINKSKTKKYTLISLYICYSIFLSCYTYIYSQKWENLNSLKKNMNKILQERNNSHNYKKTDVQF